MTWALVLLRSCVSFRSKVSELEIRIRTEERALQNFASFPGASQMQYVSHISFLKGHVCHSLRPWGIPVVRKTLCGLASQVHMVRGESKINPFKCFSIDTNVSDQCMTVVLLLSTPPPLPCLPEQALKRIPCSIVSSTWLSYLEGRKKAHDWTRGLMIAWCASGLFLMCTVGRRTCYVRFVVLCICEVAV